jgi:peptide/nickel transport system substrate-binding protein/2-iminobutanoate/2-iminopropanoate deaminase
VNAAIAATFPDPAPITTVVIAPLPVLEAAVMIEATAYLGPKKYNRGPGNARAVEAGELIITNGILSVDESGKVRDPDDISKQTQNVLANARAFLKSMKLDVADITQSQATVPDYRDFDRYNVHYRDFVPFPFPARSTAEAGLGDLSQRGLKYQIEFTAVRNASTDGIVATATENYYFKRLEIEKAKQNG